jgi:hypothetical protein
VVADMSTLAVQIASILPDGKVVFASEWSVSADAGLVAFVHGQQLYLRDMQLKTTKLVSKTPTGAPLTRSVTTVHVTHDGRFVVYTAPTAEPIGGSPNHGSLVYRYAVATDKTELITRGRNGAPSDMPCDQAGASENGKVIAFACESGLHVSNLTTAAAPMYGKITGVFVYRDPS